MAKDVIMPALGMAQESGVLVKWLVPEGANVAEGEPLMEVETDKAIVEVPANATGTLAAVAYQEGAEVAIGTVLAVILGPGEEPDSVAGGSQPATLREPSPARLSPVPGAVSAPSASGAASAPSAPAVPLAQAVPPAPGVPSASTAVNVSTEAPAPVGVAFAAGRSLGSPKAKRLAREYGVSLSSFTGTGPGGAVRAVDLIPPAAAAANEMPKAPAVPAPTYPAGSLQVAPARPAGMGWCQTTFDAAPLVRFLESVNSSTGRRRLGLPWPHRVAPSDFLARALVGALRRADAPGLADLIGDGVGVRAYTATGAAHTVVLTAAQVRTVFDAAVAREAAEAVMDPDRVSLLPVLVEDRSAQPFEQSGAQLASNTLVRLVLGPIRHGGPVVDHQASPGQNTTLRLDYAAPGLDDAGAAAVFSQLTWVLEDPFLLAVYG